MNLENIVAIPTEAFGESLVTASGLSVATTTDSDGSRTKSPTSQRMTNSTGGCPVAMTYLNMLAKLARRGRDDIDHVADWHQAKIA
jgi:hypothetical protein